MYWSITSLDLDLIPILGARSNYLTWRKHLSSVSCSDSLFSVHARRLLGISFVFCINLSLLCRSVFSGLVAAWNLQPRSTNHCHKTFSSPITSDIEARTESSRFSHWLITLIVTCYNAVGNKPFWKKFSQLRGVDCCLLTFSQNSTFGERGWGGLGGGRGGCQTSNWSSLHYYLISVTMVWS